MDILVTRKQQKYFGIFFSIAVIIPASLSIYQWWQWKRDPSLRPKPELSVLSDDFNRIPFQGEVRERKAYDRPGIIGVSGFFLSERSPSEALSLMNAYAKKNGWLPYRSEETPVLTTTLCRNGTTFSISSIPWDGGSQTSVSLTWTYHTAAANYCPSDELLKDKNHSGVSADHG